jgi:hypothetical protein
MKTQVLVRILTVFTIAMAAMLLCLGAIAYPQDAHTITPTAGLGGTIEPATPVTVPEGGTQTFTITPDPGYELVDIILDQGTSEERTYGYTRELTISNVRKDRTISATFAQEGQGRDWGWYSFAKDKHNSKIADDVIAPPFRVKWKKEPLAVGDAIARIPVALSRDGIVLALSPGVANASAVRKIAYDTKTGEELWRQVGGAAAGDGGKRTHAIIHEFVTGTHHHFSQPGNELLTGLGSPNMGTDIYANAGPENSLYASYGKMGTDSLTSVYRIYDLSNYAGPHPAANGKFGGAYKIGKNPGREKIYGITLIPKTATGQ